MLAAVTICKNHGADLGNVNNRNCDLEHQLTPLHQSNNKQHKPMQWHAQNSWSCLKIMNSPPILVCWKIVEATAFRHFLVCSLKHNEHPAATNFASRWDLFGLSWNTNLRWKSLSPQSQRLHWLLTLLVLTQETTEAVALHQQPQFQFRTCHSQMQQCVGTAIVCWEVGQHVTNHWLLQMLDIGHHFWLIDNSDELTVDGKWFGVTGGRRLYFVLVSRF